MLEESGRRARFEPGYHGESDCIEMKGNAATIGDRSAREYSAVAILEANRHAQMLVVARRLGGSGWGRQGERTRSAAGAIANLDLRQFHPIQPCRAGATRQPPRLKMWALAESGASLMSIRGHHHR